MDTKKVALQHRASKLGSPLLYFMLLRFVFAVIVGSLAASTRIQADWPQWRGPGGQGHAVASRLPAEWSEAKNVTWRTELPGRGWSSPVITGNQVWVTVAHEIPASEEIKKKRLKEATSNESLEGLSDVRIHAICIDKSSGKIVRNIPLLRKRDPQGVHKTNSYASPTPILEDGKLYSHNGSYGSTCLDLKSGEVIWTNQDLWVMHENGPGSSPILWNDLLIFHMDGSDRQFIAALEKKTGRLAWKTQRTGEMNSNPQLKKAYGTPVVTKAHGREVLVSPAADWLYGYDPATGKELWKVKYGSLGFSVVPKPVVGDGMVYIGTSFTRPQLLAFDITKAKPEIAWNCKRSVPAVSSPILVGEEIYFVSDSGGVVTCLDAKTGKEHWRERIGGNHKASPTFVGGRLLFHSREGETVVLKPGRKFSLLARNKLDGEHHASAAVSEEALFLRTNKALYKIENRQGLLGHWKFEGNVSDSSGSNNDGVAIGKPGFVEGKIGKALKLNGLNQRVDLPKLASGLNQLTIATWINVNRMPESEKFVSIYHNNGWTEGDVHLGYAGQEGVLDLGINGNAPSMSIPTFRVKDLQKRWVHLATTYNGENKKQVRFYLDGQPGEVFNLDEANPVNLGPARIGAWDVEPRLFDGQIDELYIYERVLTDEEIRELFEVGSKTPH